jgi:hypothetical protein
MLSLSALVFIVRLLAFTFLANPNGTSKSKNANKRYALVA